MAKTYDGFLFDMQGRSIPLSVDDIIKYLSQLLADARRERDEFKKQLDDIQHILDINREIDDII